MNATSVQPDPRHESILPDCSFADAYRVIGAVPALDARQAAQTIFATPSAWVVALMTVRHRIVRLFGLKTEFHQLPVTQGGRIGSFPVLAESPQEILLGLDDKHLDFRIAVTLQATNAGTKEVRVTTVVRTNNLLGRVYLATILPFHRLIVRHMLSRAAKHW